MRRAGRLLSLIGALAAMGCHRDMYDQPKFEPLEPSSFFADGQSSRPLVLGTIPRGGLQLDKALYEGIAGGKPVEQIPVPVDLELVKRGQGRFNIYCSVCHDRVGNGYGIVVQRGFRRPPSFHSDRLRDAPAGQLFTVITNGYGVMPPFGNRIDAHDRWAIVSYIRALQLSQQANAAELPPELRQRLEGAP